MSVKRRAYFTLIEIVMTMALLAIVVGAVGINVARLVQQQRFQNEVNMVTDTLIRAQQLMLLYGQNVQVNFSLSKKEKKEGIVCKIETDCKLSPAWEKWSGKDSILLNNIHLIDFKDLNYPDTHKEQMEFRFSPRGGLISRGVVGLSTAGEMGVKGAFEAYICLSGYPKAIYSSYTLPEHCDETPDPSIASITRNEVLERMVRDE